MHRQFSHLEKFCADHGNSCVWFSGQKTQLINKDRRIFCNTENCVPIVVPGLSTGSSSSSTRTSPASLPQDSVVSPLRPAGKHKETCRQNQQKPKNQIKMRTPSGHGETRCMICQNGWNNSRRILWTKESLNTGTHPRALLMNQLQSR